MPGVVSMSADLHKHGMTPKGASLMMLRSDALKQTYQMFDFRDWERGPYVAYTMQGTRPGGAIAGAWATIRHLGDEGYLRCARMIMDTKKALVESVNAIPGLAALEPSELGIFVTRATDPGLDIGAVCDAMVERGWFMGRQAEPPGIHMHLNPIHRDSWRRYLDDLRACVASVRGSRATGTAAGSTY